MEEQERGGFAVGPLHPWPPGVRSLLDGFEVRECELLKTANDLDGPVFRCVLSPGDHVAVFRYVPIERAGG